MAVAGFDSYRHIEWFFEKRPGEGVHARKPARADRHRFAQINLYQIRDRYDRKEVEIEHRTASIRDDAVQFFF